MIYTRMLLQHNIAHSFQSPLVRVKHSTIGFGLLYILWREVRKIRPKLLTLMATAFIALISYADGEKAYIIAPQRLQAGDVVVSGEKADIKPGNAMQLKSMPVGTIIHNIEMKQGKGAQLCRSAGTYAQLVGRDQGFAQIKLASGELRVVPEGCMATVGAVSNPDHMNQNFGKAGRQRWKGIRPHVRGVAMNPVDHPHGGCEGRTSGGRNPVTPWGKPTKGAKTRKNKKTNKFIIRRKKK